MTLNQFSKCSLAIVFFVVLYVVWASITAHSREADRLLDDLGWVKSAVSDFRALHGGYTGLSNASIINEVPLNNVVGGRIVYKYGLIAVSGKDNHWSITYSSGMPPVICMSFIGGILGSAKNISVGSENVYTRDDIFYACVKPVGIVVIGF